jgi:23S rRNA pseudouridine1911/1915/1917 synthase
MKLSAAMIARLKSAQAIYVNSRPVYTNYICRSGDTVHVDISAAEPSNDIAPEYGDIAVLYEDDILIAVYKPAGMLTHPSRAQFSGTLMGYVMGYLSKTGQPVCHALNRLDRHTSGIVLFAKNAYAKSICSQSISDAEKTYLAVVFGEFSDESGVIDLPIERLESGNMLRGVSPDGERAVTRYVVLGSAHRDGYNISLLRLKLETGRTHQIRVHCSSVGHPVLGDLLYFSGESKSLSDKLGLHGQLLHADRLSFIHPLSGERIDIRCPIARDDMLAVMPAFLTAHIDTDPLIARIRPECRDLSNF